MTRQTVGAVVVALLLLFAGVRAETFKNEIVEESLLVYYGPAGLKPETVYVHDTVYIPFIQPKHKWDSNNDYHKRYGECDAYDNTPLSDSEWIAFFITLWQYRVNCLLGDTIEPKLLMIKEKNMLYPHDTSFQSTTIGFTKFVAWNQADYSCGEYYKRGRRPIQCKPKDWYCEALHIHNR